MSGPQSRIAIKFGVKPASNAPDPPSSLGKRQRPSGPALLDGDDSDGDDDAKYAGKHEAITGFGEEGAETTHGKPSGPRIIKRLRNGGRYAEIEERRQQQRQERKRTHDGSAAAAAAAVGPDKDEESTAQYGLVVTTKKTKLGPDETTAPAPREPARDADTKRSAQDDAMDALLGKQPDKPRTILRPSDARSRDIPDVSTIDEYEDTPIDDFGAALLRGMGWDGEKWEPKPREREHRPNTMGIGSKALNAKDDLGAWDNKGASSDSRRSRPTLEQYRNAEKQKRDQRGHHHDGSDNKRQRDRDGAYYRQRSR